MPDCVLIYLCVNGIFLKKSRQLFMIFVKCFISPLAHREIVPIRSSIDTYNLGRSHAKGYYGRRPRGVGLGNGCPFHIG